MKNRIRYFRNLRSWTLAQLAEIVGTTPQTIQRLEVDTMTVSTDWLEKIATAFDIPPIMLLSDDSALDVPMLGTAGSGGDVRAPRPSKSDINFVLDVPAPDPVAIEIDEALGPYAKGSILIGNRMKGDNMLNALGTDAIVALQNGSFVLRKVIKGSGERFTLVPIGPDGDVLYDEEPLWIAGLVMRVEYL